MPWTVFHSHVHNEEAQRDPYVLCRVRHCMSIFARLKPTCKAMTVNPVKQATEIMACRDQAPDGALLIVLAFPG
jgi:hypothetical protein